MSPFMDVKECAEYIRLAPGTIYQLVHEGVLPARKHGRRLVFYRPDIDSWSAERVRKPKVKVLSKFELARERLRSEGRIAG